ncbi:MAG: GNAT family N-acetyltransferase [Solirubrobacterales bacterium]|nr:GNAT family N-acetyltransferase [Solirubrobacterales bacterium]
MSTRVLDRVETERLVCERMRRDHADELSVLLLDPRVARTLFPASTRLTDAMLLASLEEKLEHWARYGFGLWLLRDRATGKMVGRGGLQHTAVEGEEAVEVAWAVAPERWREGLATELALAAVDVAFGDLGLEEIVAFTLPENVASRRVMQKAGFAYYRDVERAGLPHVLYRRRRPETYPTL